jgi:hypothetical protein
MCHSRTITVAARFARRRCRLRQNTSCAHEAKSKRDANADQRMTIWPRSRSLAEMLSCRAFYWGSAANAFLQPHHRVKLASDQEIFTVKLLTIANYPPFL